MLTLSFSTLACDSPSGRAFYDTMEVDEDIFEFIDV
jgi:hypothetical protein